jgi:hypothetical protein
MRVVEASEKGSRALHNGIDEGFIGVFSLEPS